MTRNAYVEWLIDSICERRSPKHLSYRKLLSYLFDTDFRYLIPNDANRAENGMSLRYRFAFENGYEGSYADIILEDLDGPCSLLEMMVALALDCEAYMDDPAYGNRTGQWFWSMIVNLGLGTMTDLDFDIDYVEDVIETFLNRDYEPDGTGGLFRIRNCRYDMRDVEIWYQLCEYINSIT